MTIKDIHGHALSGADANATEHYEAACAMLRCSWPTRWPRPRPHWRRHRT